MLVVRQDQTKRGRPRIPRFREHTLLLRALPSKKQKATLGARAEVARRLVLRDTAGRRRL
jgi:hypothetical protein